jgi:hypothetical protein
MNFNKINRELYVQINNKKFSDFNHKIESKS